jgi:3-phosphoshikimate 1-carboxyvinyltransferase
LDIQGQGFTGWDTPASVIDCGNSGTTLRLLAGALATIGVPVTLDGSPGLRRRPMNRIIDPLQKMGVNIRGDDGHAPLRLEPAGKVISGIDYHMPVASAQVKTCLLLAALNAEGQTTLREPGPSRDHTERLLRGLGVTLVNYSLRTSGSNSPPELVQNRERQYITTVTPQHPPHLPPFYLQIPGDISSAAFIIVAALITPGSDVLIEDIGINPTRTGLLDALVKMGGNIEIQKQGERMGEPYGTVRVRHSPLSGIDINGELVVRMIDEFPAFSIAAVYAHGTTVVSGAEELRVKESDRIAAMCKELKILGIPIVEKPDGFVIPGNSKPRGGQVSAHGDHRLAMALAVAGLQASTPVRILGAEIIAESFPTFTEVLRSTGADLTSEEDS